jgi:hypothetical protein
MHEGGGRDGAGQGGAGACCLPCHVLSCRHHVARLSCLCSEQQLSKITCRLAASHPLPHAAGWLACQAEWSHSTQPRPWLTPLLRCALLHCAGVSWRRCCATSSRSTSCRCMASTPFSAHMRRCAEGGLPGWGSETAGLTNRCCRAGDGECGLNALPSRGQPEQCELNWM